MLGWIQQGSSDILKAVKLPKGTGVQRCKKHSCIKGSCKKLVIMPSKLMRIDSPSSMRGELHVAGKNVTPPSAFSYNANAEEWKTFATGKNWWVDRKGV